MPATALKDPTPTQPSPNYKWTALANTTAAVFNSAAILTDAFPAEQRGFALGTNQVAGLAGMFIGLIAGGLLATLDWRAIFWVNVPVGIYGTVWAYLKLRETRQPSGKAQIDWWGNITFAVAAGEWASGRVGDPGFAPGRLPRSEPEDGVGGAAGYSGS